MKCNYPNGITGLKTTQMMHKNKACVHRKPAAAIFTSTHEVHSILQQHSVHNNVDDVARPYPAYADLERCSSVSPLSGGGVACQCSRPVEFYWYPCALKYCRNQDSVSSLHIFSYHQIRGFLFAKSAFQALYFSALFCQKTQMFTPSFNLTPTL